MEWGIPDGLFFCKNCSWLKSCTTIIGIVYARLWNSSYDFLCLPYSIQQYYIYVTVDYMKYTASKFVLD